MNAFPAPEAMASLLRPGEAWGESSGPWKPAAVLLPLLPAPEGWQVLLIRRSMEVEAHRGQIGCPGGRREPTDASPLATALRETDEELGIPPEQVRVLGGLPCHVTSTTGFQIHPFVGILSPDPVLRPDPREVAGVLTVPLAFFLDPAHHEIRPMVMKDGVTHPVHFYTWGEDTIWGATAAILHHFAQRIRPMLEQQGDTG